MPLALKGTALFLSAHWCPWKTRQGAPAAHPRWAPCHQQQPFRSGHLGSMQAGGLEVKGSIAHKPVKCFSAGPDKSFYFHCSSIADPSYIRGDKLSGIPGVRYLHSSCPPHFFSWAHTPHHTSYSLVKLFTTRTGIRDGDSLTIFPSSPELPLYQHPEHKTETQSGALPTAVSCWLYPSATWQLQWEETGLRQKLSYEKVLSPYLFLEGSLLPEKPQLFSKGGISAAACDSSDRWKTSAYLFHYRVTQKIFKHREIYSSAKFDHSNPDTECHLIKIG